MVPTIPLKVNIFFYKINHFFCKIGENLTKTWRSFKINLLEINSYFKGCEGEE